jgi:hypothetical protein
MNLENTPKPSPVEERASNFGPNPADRTAVLVGGLCGLVAVGLYLASITLLHDVTHGFPVEASRPAIVAAWWVPALIAPFGIASVYALHRLLAGERDGALNALAFIFGVIAFAMVALMVTVQNAVLLEVSEYAREAPATDLENWRSIMRGVRSVDHGTDLVWDLFLGLWILLSAQVMRKHSRFGLKWAIPATLIAVVFLIVNAITVPFPPASEGLIDVGPLAGLYAAVLYVYLVKIGLQKRPVGLLRPNVKLPTWVAGLARRQPVGPCPVTNRLAR